MTRRSRPGEERGAVIVLTALSMVAVMLIAGLVLDIGLARAERKQNKSGADHAAAAGMRAMAHSDGRPRPWAAVCEAHRFVVTNRYITSFTTETWETGSGTPVTAPCTDSSLLSQPCIPGDPDTYAVFHGTISGDRGEVEIRSGYVMPDTAWGDDAADTDVGDPTQQGCDQLAVMITERQSGGFGSVLGGGHLETRVRSVGRAIIGDLHEANVALVLLERHDCRALRTEGANSRVKVSSAGNQPGLIQADSAGDGHCPGGTYVVEGQTTDSGPSILAESYVDPVTGAVTPSKIGISAKALGFDRSHTPYPTTVGDTDPVGSKQIGRRSLDERYLAAVRNLASTAHTRIYGPTPPTTDPDWKVFSGSECTIDAATTLNTDGKSKIWFSCDQLWVKSGGLTIDAPGVEIVVASANSAQGGSLRIDAPLRIHDPRTIWIRGEVSGGNPRGVAVGSSMIINDGGTGSCPTELGPDGETRHYTPDGKHTTLFVGAGHFEVSGGQLTMCSTFALVYGANVAAAGALPSTAGTPPTTRTDIKSTFVTTAGGQILSWTASNELRDAQPTPEYLAAHPFEDLALWTEASDPSVVTGGGGSRIAGVFALPNANDFTVSGGGAPDLPADAQFFTRKLRVTGGGLVTIKPNPNDSVPVPFFLDFVLVR